MTALRFWAALWVVLFHYKPYAGPEAVGWAVLGKGYLAVDFFFMLSGFVLAHVYRGSLEAGTYSRSGFIIKRLARIYPMHIATLAFFVLLALAGPKLGVPADPQRFDFSKLPQHILLVHAWFGDGQQFNFPSWSISAEFFAYLAFPIVMMLGRWPRTMLALGVLATFGWYWLAVPVAGAPSTHLSNWQIMRIMPEFLLGAGLREAMERPTPVLSRILGARSAVGAALLAVLALAALNAPDWAMLIALVILLAAGAERGRMRRDGLLERPASVYLGEISYGLYMVHIAVANVAFHILDLFMPRPQETTAASLLTTALVAGLAVATSALTHRLIEEPGQALILQLRKMRLRPLPAERS